MGEKRQWRHYANEKMVEQNASIGTNFGTHVQIHLEMVMGEIKITPCDLGRIWGVLGAENQKSGINYQTDGPIGTKFCTHVRIHLGMDIG